MADDDKKEEKLEEAKKEAQESAQAAEKSADAASEAAETAEKAEEKAETAANEAKETTQEAKKVVQEAKSETAKEETKANDKPQVKVSKKLENLISEIEKLSVLELSELVKALEAKFGVSASPVAVAATAQAASAGSEEGVSEQTTFNVILADSGANKISVIKAVREIVPTLGLKEAKDLVDAAPKPVVEGVNKENAQEAKQKLEAAGAKVELK